MDTKQAVISAFLRGEKANAGEFKSDGTTLFTYAVPIAKRSPEGVREWVLPTPYRSPSVTTTRHLTAVVLSGLKDHNGKPLTRNSKGMYE